MKYKKDEHVYVIYRSQVCNATVLDWNIEKPDRGPTEVRYLVHLSYRPDRKKEVWKEEDLWVDSLSVMKQGLHVDEKEVRNLVGKRKEGLLRYSTEVTKDSRKAASLPRDFESLKEMFLKKSGYYILRESVLRCCQFQGVDCPASIAKDLEDLLKDCEEHAAVLAREPGAAGKELETQSGDAGDEPRSALEGRIYVHSVFVSRCWVRPRNLEVWEGHLVEAERWLKNQAEAHGKKVTFVNGWTGFDGMPVYWRRSGGFGRVAEQMAFLERVLSLSGLRSIDGIARLAEKHRCDRHAILIMVDEPGRSFAMCCSESPFLGHAVIFNMEESWYHDMMAGTLAHEILHFFGAEDLYVDKGVPDHELKRRARTRWPNDVMNDSHKPCTDLALCPYTAAKVGWMEEKDVWADKGAA